MCVRDSKCISPIPRDVARVIMSLYMRSHFESADFRQMRSVYTSTYRIRVCVVWIAIITIQLTIVYSINRGFSKYKIIAKVCTSYKELIDLTRNPCSLNYIGTGFVLGEVRKLQKKLRQIANLEIKISLTPEEKIKVQHYYGLLHSHSIFISSYWTQNSAESVH